MLTRWIVLAIAASLAGPGLTLESRAGQRPHLRFYVAPADPGAKLPADGIYPLGRKMAFAGYSGDPARDLNNGFTLAGPVYGDQTPYLAKCFSNGWPVIAHVGPKVTFNDKAPDKYKFDAPSLREAVEKQVRELDPHKEIAWWAIHPEELRPWRKDEMQYLAIVSETIRKHDPLLRPLFLYNPNHRDAASLAPIAKQVDIVAKGCYVNLSNRKRERAWVRWSVEQELEALRLAGRPESIAIVMPELCRDPEPEEDREIRAWVRHDVYLGLASGAKGVLIWSLFKRKEVRRTWQTWYDAYAECGRELNGPRKLADVFLFGERRSDLMVKLTTGSTAAKVALGGNAEPTTTSERERADREIKVPSWTAAEFAYGSSRWLFLINSANAPASFTITGWPDGSRSDNAFDGAEVKLPQDTPLRMELPAYGVLGVRFSQAMR